MRLVIYVEDKSGRLKEVENVKAVARLRNYLNDDHTLSDEGIKILINTLKGFQEVTRFHKLSTVKCVATATVRQAINQSDILSAVRENTDFQIRILSEYEEAYYGFLAVVNSTSFHEGITIDIGGGSTEITYFKNRRLQEFHSFPFGALSLKKQFIKGDTPTNSELKQIQQFVKSQFDSLPWLKKKNLPIIAIGGSARNLVQIDQAMRQYPLSTLHQYAMTPKDIGQVQSYLKSLSFDKLQRVDGLSKDRADIIVPSTEVFIQLCEVVEPTTFVLSRKGLRDGVFYEELLKQFGRTTFPKVMEESFQELAVEYDIDIQHSLQVTSLLMTFVDKLQKIYPIDLSSSDFQLLRYSSFVYNLGQYIDSESSSQHTFYLLSNRTIDGFMHKDQLTLALVASFKNHATFKQYVQSFQDWFTKDEQKKLRFMGAVLKFTYCLNATKRNIVKDMMVMPVDQETMKMTFYCDQNWQPEEYQVEKQKKHLEKVLKQKVKLEFKSHKEQMMHIG